MPEPNAKVIERKARPIYDALVRKDYKGALKQCNQVLGKYPNNPLILILKAYAYERMNQLDEAFKLVDIIAEIGTDDDEVLQHVSTLLKSHNQHERLLQVYTRSTANHPNDLGLQQDLFLCHVRLDNVIAQQQIAMKINKAAPTEMQLFWVICSMLSQAAKRAAGDTSITMEPAQLLKMAGTLAKKQLQKEGGLSYDALLVYLDVLQAQGAHAEALAILEGSAGAAVQLPHELLRLKAQLLMAMGELEQAAELLKEGLTSINADDWAGYMLYFNCLLPSTAHPFGDAADGVITLEGGFGSLLSLFQSQEWWLRTVEAQGDVERDANISQLANTVEALVSQVEEKGDMVRAPYLARVELTHRKLQLHLCEAGDLAAATLEYFQRFKHKPMTHLDLQRYVAQLRGEARIWLSSALQRELDCAADEAKDAGEWNLARIRHTMNVLRILQTMGLPEFLDEAAAVKHAHKCMNLFMAWVPVMGQQAERDLAVGEDVAAMAADAFVAAHRYGNLKYLVQAIIVLHAAAATRSYSAPIQFSLSALYGLMGCADAALASFAALEIRQVQLDTLSHHVVPFLASLSAPAAAAPYYHDVLAVQRSIELSGGTMLAECYTNATFSKVLEFILFKQRERASVTFLEAESERALLQLRKAMHGCTAAPRPASGKDSKKSGAASTAMQQQALAEAMRAVPFESATSDAMQRRFINDDLQQRPAWFPPSTTTSTMAVMEWWGMGDDSPTCNGSSQPWWQVPDAAASGSNIAERWRDLRLKSVQMRALQPILLAGSMLHPEVPDITKAMSALLGAGGLTWAEVDAWWRSHEWKHDAPFARTTQTEGTAHPCLLDSFRFLNVSTFALGSALQGVAQLLQQTHGSAPLDDLALRSARSLEALVPDRVAMVVDVACSVAFRASTSLCSASAPLASGGVLSSLLVFVEEDLHNLVMCYQCWHASFLKVKEKHDAPPELKALQSKVAGALDVLRQGLQHSCSSVAKALSDVQLSTQTGAALVDMAVDAFVQPDMAALKVLGNNDVLRKPLEVIVEAQKSCINQAGGRLEQHLALLADLS